ncbi:MAG TPA: hypothetical protein VKU00_04725 [Chthonomonadaceae bacterium]|nr:hypothetical protein [Chthonomonadaceae bacterium]
MSLKLLFLGSFPFLCALTAISCHRDPATQPHTVDGITVAPYIQKNEELADALGGGVWRFDVTATDVLCEIEI